MPAFLRPVNNIVPTRPAGTSDNSAASTAFVGAAIATAVPSTRIPWVPDLQFGGGKTGITYVAVSGQLGFYIRIGSIVVGDFSITLTSKGSSTGAATLAGLPFAVAGGSTGGVSVTFYANMAGIVVLGGFISSGGSSVGFANGGAATSALADDTNFTNTSQFFGAFYYLAA